MTIKEKILKIMSLALDINPPEVSDIGMFRTAVFVRWSPHCNSFSVDIYYWGWRGEKRPDKKYIIYTGFEDAGKELGEIINLLEIIKAEQWGNKVKEAEK